MRLQRGNTLMKGHKYDYKDTSRNKGNKILVLKKAPQVFKDMIIYKI